MSFSLKLLSCPNVKMSSGLMLSPTHSITKTRNAILRMKKCSPELRTILRQRCQQRIQNDRLKILYTFRKIKIQDSFRVAFGNILKEEWKSIDDESSKEASEDVLFDLPPHGFSLDDKLLMEEMLERELLIEHEDWLNQLYEDLLSEDIEDSKEVVCPLCCSGYLKQIECQGFNKTLCSKCPGSFAVEKPLLDLQNAIYECLSWHDKQCNYNSTFLSVPKNESENNLCNVCHHCSHLYIIE